MKSLSWKQKDIIQDSEFKQKFLSFYESKSSENNLFVLDNYME